MRKKKTLRPGKFLFSFPNLSSFREKIMMDLDSKQMSVFPSALGRRLEQKNPDENLTNH
jgi:hypothetical protein